MCEEYVILLCSTVVAVGWVRWTLQGRHCWVLELDCCSESKVIHWSVMLNNRVRCTFMLNSRAWGRMLGVIPMAVSGEESGNVGREVRWQVGLEVQSSELEVQRRFAVVPSMYLWIGGGDILRTMPSGDVRGLRTLRAGVSCVMRLGDVEEMSVSGSGYDCNSWW